MRGALNVLCLFCLGSGTASPALPESPDEQVDPNRFVLNVDAVIMFRPGHEDFLEKISSFGHVDQSSTYASQSYARGPALGVLKLNVSSHLWIYSCDRSSLSGGNCLDVSCCNVHKMHMFSAPSHTQCQAKRHSAPKHSGTKTHTNTYHKRQQYQEDTQHILTTHRNTVNRNTPTKQHRNHADVSTDTHRQTQTDRHRHRHRYTPTHTHTPTQHPHTHTPTHTHQHTNTHQHTPTHTDTNTHTKTHRHTHRHTHRETQTQTPHTHSNRAIQRTRRDTPRHHTIRHYNMVSTQHTAKQHNTQWSVAQHNKCRCPFARSQTQVLVCVVFRWIRCKCRRCRIFVEVKKVTADVTSPVGLS